MICRQRLHTGISREKKHNLIKLYESLQNVFGFKFDVLVTEFSR